MEKYADCIKVLEESQESEYDMRNIVREADHFINKRDGQWDPAIISKLVNKPRFTFDECNPIVDDIMGEMETMDFDIRVNPSGGESSKDTANIFEGIIRNIENISGARFIYNDNARVMVSTGFSAWRVVTDYASDNTFDQDLLIQTIPNVVDSVWFDPNATQRNMSDASFCWRLASLTRAAYEKRYPKGSGLSVGNDLNQSVYDRKKTHEVIIGEYFYKKKKKRDLILLSNGDVIADDDKTKQRLQHYQGFGVTEVDRREREYTEVYHRLFDGGDWLNDDQLTVFSYIPIIPLYGNFKISENKVIYWGAIEKLIDPQRIINYALSRKIEEGALSSKPKHWMTKDQAKSPDVRRTLRTFNTNNDPVQFYDHIEGQPPPFVQQPPPSNHHLIETAASATNYIQRTSGTFDEARGQAPPNRSGLAIEKLQMKSDNPKRKWFTAVEVAIHHTCRILIEAIPKVYDAKRIIRLVEQDGNTNMVEINAPKLNEQTGQYEPLNDLSKGTYDVVCSAGPAFTSRQQETVSTILEVAKINPTIMQVGADVLLNNINAPGMEDIAARVRAQMVQQGIIPPDQLTEEEKQTMQQQAQAQANKPPDPMTMAAQAEMAKAQVRGQEAQLKAQIEAQKLAMKERELAARQQTENNKQIGESIKAMNEQAKIQAETLKLIKEAMGADAIVNESAAVAYDKQAKELTQTINP